jgi:hypothetical protein
MRSSVSVYSQWNTMIRKIDVVLFAALSLSCASPSHSPVRANHSNDNVLPRAPVEVALALYFRELRTVQVTSGRDTLRLLLDTGGGHTLVTPEAAHRLGCEPFGRSVGHRMSGERVEFQWCNDIRLLVRDVPLAAARVAVFDLGAVLPPELPSLDGLLSLKSFADHVVTIDMARDRLIFESAPSAEGRKAEQQPLRARVATGEDGTSLSLFIAAAAPKAPVWLLLDNGNLVGTILSPPGARQLKTSGADPQVGDAIAVELELIGLPSRRTEVLVRDVIYDGVLGAHFFREHVLTLDLRGRDPLVGAAPARQ